LGRFSCDPGVRRDESVDSDDATAIKQRVREQFAGSAAAYVASVGHAAGLDLARMVEVVETRPADRLLDVATGGGHVARAFGPLVAGVVIADLTPTMLERAGAFLISSGIENVRSVAADAESMPFRGESFDVVTCRIAPHHFPRPDRFVGEVGRVLKAGGRFALVDSTVPQGTLGEFFNRFEKLRDPSHVRSLTVDEWTALVANAGLDLRATEPFPKRHDFDDWTERARVDRQTRDALVEMMKTAGSDTQQAFRVEWDGDRLVGFTDAKTLFYAAKPL
jgi:ubiquinone/menaquinone biosynthesis C-methylase UbiE